MKKNTKSSVTLPPKELELVNDLMKSLKAKSKVEVIRRGLTLLKETTDRKALRASFQEASNAVRKDIHLELESLDAVTDEGLDE
jgi:Arc/MetJ-type ribon-helix-helix transcriptional regulator